MDTPEKLGALLSAAGYADTRIWPRTFEHRWIAAALVYHARVLLAVARTPS